MAVPSPFIFNRRGAGDYHAQKDEWVAAEVPEKDPLDLEVGELIRLTATPSLLHDLSGKSGRIERVYDRGEIAVSIDGVSTALYWDDGDRWLPTGQGRGGAIADDIVAFTDIRGVDLAALELYAAERRRLRTDDRNTLACSEE